MGIIFIMVIVGFISIGVSVGFILSMVDERGKPTTFAAQALGCIRELGLDMERTNVNGSGVSIGHPIGCTGARIVLGLVNELARRGGKYGLASLCIGGGQGGAMLLERGVA